MNFIGFDTALEPNIRDAMNFSEMLYASPGVAPEKRELYIQYLKKGYFLTGSMSFIYDNENNPIGNLDYFTDGQNVWPCYYVYYLQKYPDYFIDDSLLYILNTNDLSANVITQEKLTEIEKAFDYEWGGFYKK